MTIKTFLKTLALVLLISTPLAAQEVQLIRQPSAEYGMRQGYYDCETLWYVPLAASNQLIAKQLNKSVNNYGVCVDWAPAMDCALEKDVLGDVYFINCAQTTIFSTQPGNEDYTPLWRVHYLEWAPGVTPMPLCAAADVVAAILAGDLLEQGSPSVLDATIVVDTYGEAMDGLYSLSYKMHTVQFWAYAVFYFDKYNPLYNTRNVLIADVSNEVIANALGANYAPRLTNASPDCCGCFDAITVPVPPQQLPIICQAPFYGYAASDLNGFDGYKLNLNKKYSPVLCWKYYDRTGLAPYAVVKTYATLQKLIGLGLLTEVIVDPPDVSNSPVTPILPG